MIESSGMKELKNFMFQKYLGLALNVKFNFVEPIKIVTQKISKTGSIAQISTNFTKHFIGSQLACAGVIYDQGYNCSLHENFEYLQYNACLVTGVIRWTPPEKNISQTGLRIFKIQTLVWKTLSFLKTFAEKVTFVFI